MSAWLQGGASAGVAQLGAALAIAVYLSAEWRLRRPSARSFRGGRFDGGTTALASAANLTGLLLPWAVWLVAGAPEAPPAPAVQAGLALLLGAGIALRFWAMHTLGAFFSRSLRVVPGQHVVASGPYRFVRHPGYLAALLVLPSYGALASGRLAVGAVAVLLLAAVYARRIPAEERMLAEGFGPAWERYRQRTGRLLPALRRPPAPEVGHR